jgi:hypothetical protein
MIRKNQFQYKEQKDNETMLIIQNCSNFDLKLFKLKILR